MKSSRKGRAREYGDENAVRATFSLPPALLAAFRDAWAKQGSRNLSRAVQVAMRLWLAQSAGKPGEAAATIPRTDREGKAEHVHVTLPAAYYSAVQLHAAKTARSAPEVFREALALYIRARADAPEFAGLDEWRYVREPEHADGERPSAV